MALDQDKVLGRLAEHALIPETRSGKKKRISEIPLPFFFFFILFLFLFALSFLTCTLSFHVLLWVLGLVLALRSTQPPISFSFGVGGEGSVLAKGVFPSAVSHLFGHI